MTRLRPVIFLFLALSACTSTSVITPINQEIKISKNEIISVDDRALAECLTQALKLRGNPEVKARYLGINGDWDTPAGDVRYEITTNWENTRKNIEELKGYTRIWRYYAYNSFTPYPPQQTGSFIHFGEGGAFACMSRACLGLAWIPAGKILNATVSNPATTGNEVSGLTVSVKAERKIVVIGFSVPIPLYIPFVKSAACDALAEEIINHLDIIDSAETTEVTE